MTNRLSRILRLGALGAAAALAACADDPEVFQPTPTEGDGLFDRYVAIGNSITMGWQSFGVNDSTQRRSFAYLFAQQVGTRFAYPSMRMPGCPPPLENIQTLRRVDGSSLGDTPCSLRDPASVTEVLNNVAWYNAFAADPFAPTSANQNVYTTFVLGGRTQVQRALEANPTFATVWLGNNDLLVAAHAGITTPVPNVSPGITPVAEFTTSLTRVVDDLVAGAPGVQGALFSVVNVTNAPTFFPAQALFNPAFKAGFDLFAGTPTTLLPSCTPTSTSLINFRIVLEIRTGRHPATIGCTKNSLPGVPGAQLVGDVFVLEAAEIAEFTAAANAYNAAIQAKADEEGWAYVDVNPTLVQLRASGGITVVPNLASATAPFGEYMSLDGTHPGNKAHVVVTNLLIEAVNAKYGTSIELLPNP